MQLALMVCSLVALTTAAPVPSWGFCGVYLPRFEKMNALASEVCNSCVESFYLWDPDKAAKCRWSCFTTDHFLMCAREALEEKAARNLTSQLRRLDAWWQKSARQQPQHQRFVAQYRLL